MCTVYNIRYDVCAYSLYFEIGIRMKEEQELTFDRLKTDIYAYNSKLGCNDGET